jgi:sugar phosphate isomerase/epimerase
MRRRSFLAAAAGASVLPLLSGCETMGAGAPSSIIPQRKLDRIAIAGSVFRAQFDNWQYSVPAASPRLSYLTYPAYVRERFGVHKIELWERQFFPQGLAEAPYRAVRAAADAAGVSIINLQVEALPALDAGGAVERATVLAGIKSYLDKGRVLGAGSIRVNVTREGGPVNLDAIIDTLRRAAEYGQAIGVKVLIENHGGYTASIPNMIALVKAVNHDFCKITIDWGDFFGPPGDRYAAIQEAMPYVHIVSAKGFEFDPVTYEHSAYDIARLVRNAEAGGFRGDYSIDFFGPNPPQDPDRAMRLFIKTITDNMA